MKIEIVQLTENPDGSASLVLDIDAEGVELMMRVAIKSLLDHALEITKELKTDDSELSVGDTKRGSFDCGDGEGEQSSKQGQPSNGFQTSQVSG